MRYLLSTVILLVASSVVFAASPAPTTQSSGMPMMGGIGMSTLMGTQAPATQPATGMACCCMQMMQMMQSMNGMGMMNMGKAAPTSQPASLEPDHSAHHPQ